MLSVEVLTLFPRMIAAPLQESILGKAQEKGLLRVRVRDIREHAEGKHRNTDDVPYGGGAGMVMKPEPLVAAIEAARAALEADAQPAGAQPAAAAHVILLSPQGARFDQRIAERLARLPRLALVCGRYEGIDERVMPSIDEELSLGDFVLTGGEFAALAVIDAVARLLPGVLGNDESLKRESFSTESTDPIATADSRQPTAGTIATADSRQPTADTIATADRRPPTAQASALGLLEGPQYTRPPEFRGLAVPEELLSGDHARIARWRRQQALLRTQARRPDLFAQVSLSAEDEKLLAAAGPSASSLDGRSVLGQR